MTGNNSNSNFLVPLEEAKIRKEEKFAQKFLEGFAIKYDVYRLKKAFADYMIICQTPTNPNTKNIIIECKQFLWRKNFYQACLELLCADRLLTGNNALWIVCTRFYNMTSSRGKRYENATFLKILDMLGIKVVELKTKK